MSTELTRRHGLEGAWGRLRLVSGRPVDIAGLAYFRIAFGAIMAWEMWRFLDPSHNWVERYYTGHDFYFGYWPFTFIRPMPEPWIQGVFVLTGVAAILVTLGLFFRPSATVLFAGLTYVFLLDKARYLNHFYLICLLAFLLIFLPANRAFSVDARRKPSLRSETAPAWSLWLLRFQIGIPYFFGGVAKLNPDWLRAEPLRSWLADRTDFPVVGTLFTNNAVVWAMAYASVLLDLTVVAFLLNRRTRPYAFVAVAVFHLMNSRLFGIGIFPWVMIAGTVLFFDPTWPRRLAAVVRSSGKDTSRQRWWLWVGAAVGFWLGGFLPETLSYWRAAIGGFAGMVAGYHLAESRDASRGRQRDARRTAPAPRKRRKVRDTTPSPAVPVAAATMVALLSWAAIQVVVPLRHLVIPGNVHWTEEGHNYSWHMKLRDKESDATFVVTADGRDFVIDNDDYLTSRQESKMASRPHMIVQYAHHLENLFEREGYTDVQVRGEVYSSLNGRFDELLIDPDFDLTTQRYPWIGHAEWIRPLTEPLRDAGPIAVEDD